MYSHAHNVQCTNDQRPNGGSLIEFTLSQQPSGQYKVEKKTTWDDLREEREITTVDTLAEDLDCVFDKKDKLLFTCWFETTKPPLYYYFGVAHSTRKTGLNPVDGKKFNTIAIEGLKNVKIKSERFKLDDFRVSSCQVIKKSDSAPK